MHDSIIYPILMSYIKDVSHKDFVPRHQVLNLMLTSQYCKDIVNRNLICTKTAFRRERLYNIIRTQPKNSRCYPVLMIENRHIGFFSIERTEDKIRICRPSLDFTESSFTMYYTLLADFVNILNLLPEFIEVEIEPIWGWGLERYEQSILQIKKVIQGKESFEDDVFIYFDNKQYTEGTFSIQKCSAMVFTSKDINTCKV
jgi:hypothetical protein